MTNEDRIGIFIEIDGDTLHYHRNIDKESAKIIFEKILENDKGLKEALSVILRKPDYEFTATIQAENLLERLSPEKLFYSTDKGETFKELKLVKKGGKR